MYIIFDKNGDQLIWTPASMLNLDEGVEQLKELYKGVEFRTREGKLIIAYMKIGSSTYDACLVEEQKYENKS